MTSPMLWLLLASSFIAGGLAGYIIGRCHMIYNRELVERILDRLEQTQQARVAAEQGQAAAEARVVELEAAQTVPSDLEARINADLA